MPSALFCISDALALSVLKAAKELGVDIPGRLSLVGFDNLEIDDLVNPRLTSVEIPKRVIAQEATAALIQQMEGEGPHHPKKVLLTGTIVYRDSVADIRKTKQ